MYTWIMLLCLVVIGILALSQAAPVEGFMTLDPAFQKTQRQQLQLEGERRYNHLGQIQNTESSLSNDIINEAVTQSVPNPSASTSSLLSLVQNSVGIGGGPTRSQPGPSVEQTGAVQQKINFCEQQPINCDFGPQMAECGICHRNGVNSKGAPWRGGMYISSDDQIRANELAKTTGNPAQYKPTVGSCDPADFTIMQPNCQARENQLACFKEPGATAENSCGQCYGSSGPLLYVGAKPKSFNAILHMSHPGTNGTGATITVGNVPYTLAPSTAAILDYKQLPLILKEGDTVSIVINGLPKVWCAWLSSQDGKRSISITMGGPTISPTNSIGIVGDKRSSMVTNAFRTVSGFAAFAATVPSTVMWYGRRETLPGIPVSANYGDSATSGVNVLARLRTLAATNSNISIPTGIGQTAGTTTQSLWMTMDNGRSYIVTDGQSLDKRNIYSRVAINITIPATLADPFYQVDIPSCPVGPIIHTPAGAGLMGANSCFTASGTFNPSMECLQQLFTGAGGTAAGTLYPSTAARAATLVQKTNGTPDLTLTSDYLNNLGNIATYGTTSAGAAVSFADYADASMKMLGTTPLSFCDGPNRDTGPHTPACLDFLWRTSGSTTTPSSGVVPPYGFCTAAGTSAPLNPNGTPNENNIAIINNIGSVANVKAYYKALYDSAQNTDLNSANFPVWAAAMKKCYNVNATEPVAEPEACNKPSVAGINIMEASYGKNCNPALQGNRTQFFQSLANGLPAFNFPYDYRYTGGDPAYGCPKAIDITYNCSGGDPQTYSIPGEAGFSNISFRCGPPTQPVTVVEASYGKNCINTHPQYGNLQGNRTGLFQSLANGKQSLTYVYDYTRTGGDPAGGCPKNMDITYKCGNVTKPPLHIPGESGIGSVVNLTC